MGQPLKGKDFVLLLSKAGEMIPVCCGRELSISINSEVLEATKAPQSTWRSYYYGIKDYTISFSGLTMVGDSFTFNDFYNAISNRETLAFVCRSDEESDIFLSGNVLINKLDLTGPNKDVISHTVTATGDGPLNNSNPYAINILMDEDGNPLEDEDGNVLVEYENGDLLPINYDINC